MKKYGLRIWQIIEKTIYIILNKIYKIANKEISEKKFLEYTQFVKFAIVGMSNTIISYILYLVSLLILQKYKIFPNIDYIISQMTAFVISVFWSFWWNRKIVFKKNEKEKLFWWKSLWRTYVAYSFTGLFLNSLLLILWVRFFHISEVIAPFINLIFSVPLNFIINKFWTFR